MRVKLSIIPSTVLVGALLFGNVFALNNGLGRTPAMGFNTWNYFGCNGSDPDGASRPIVTGAVFLAIANAFVTSGMKDAGYKYVNYDDCWAEGSRDARGGLVPKRSVFGNNIRVYVDSIHSLGLYMGLYGDAADRTCAGTMPGQLGHEQQDADSLVAWGVDYFKYDWCGRSGDPRGDFSLMRNCLQRAYDKAVAAGNTKARKVLYSICNWGQGTVKPWIWGDTTGNSWRTTYDIRPNWGSVMGIYDQNVALAQYAKPGAFNDADMLEVGNGMNLTDDQTHFALWCMMGSPLLAGNDVRNMNASIKGILTNKDVIAVNQDSLGIQCRKVKVAGTAEILAKKLRPMTVTPLDTTPDYAVCFFNRGSAAANFSITLTEISAADPTGFRPDVNADYAIKDLISKATSAQKGNVAFTATGVASHAVKMIRISKVKVGIAQVVSPAQKQPIAINAYSRQILITGVQANAHVSLVDLKGSVLFKQSSVDKNAITIPAQNFAKGIYLVTVTSGKSTISRNVVLR